MNVTQLVQQPAMLSALRVLLRVLGVRLVIHRTEASLPGSYWGDSEAGVSGRSLHVRGDTPLHSLLHEACHIACAGAESDRSFDRDAGGCDDEEAGVCFMQIRLADALPGAGADRLCQDMDDWGYSFREGSAAAFANGDAQIAGEWLRKQRPFAWQALHRLGVV